MICTIFFTVINSYRQKSKKQTTTQEWEGMGVILLGLGREEINFCGSETGEV